MSEDTHCDTHCLSNMIKEPTCFKNILNPSSIDLILTNRSRMFQNSIAIETGLSDHHKLTITVMRSLFLKNKLLLLFLIGSTNILIMIFFVMNFCGIYIIGTVAKLTMILSKRSLLGYLTNMHHLRKGLSEQITPHS